MNDKTVKLLRQLPAIDTLLQSVDGVDLCAYGSAKVATAALRKATDAIREMLIAGKLADASSESLIAKIWRDSKVIVAEAVEPYFRKVLNATGIILHTGLGRSVLSAKAMDQINDNLRGYSLLQLDKNSGKRGKRGARIEWLLKELTGCEAATVVNNNAAATMIVLNAVAGDGKEVIVSRGQLVEIGGSFRLPEVFAASGATMVEVGTTNKTHLRDYANAITENTAAILRVHPSNYQIKGFSSEVALPELEKLAHERGLCMIDDIGAGALIDYSKFGFIKEPTLLESVQTGADLITSSADKLIAASQGGIILGKKSYVDKIRQSPLARILRVDKLTMAALEATLIMFLKGDAVYDEMPTLRMLRRTADDIEQQAIRVINEVRKSSANFDAEVIDGCSQMGSGSLPDQDLATRLIAINTTGIDAKMCELRNLPVPLFARIQNERILMDCRTILPGEEEQLIQNLSMVFA